MNKNMNPLEDVENIHSAGVNEYIAFKNDDFYPFLGEYETKLLHYMQKSLIKHLFLWTQEHKPPKHILMTFNAN